jgi:hypothetical protein
MAPRGGRAGQFGDWQRYIRYENDVNMDKGGPQWPGRPHPEGGYPFHWL